MIYLDNASTTKPYKEVCDVVISSFDNFGNPSSLHNAGRLAEAEIKKSKALVAGALCCENSEVYFASGGTESNNLALLGAANAKKRFGNTIISTEIEHPSVLNVLKKLESDGFNVVLVKPRECGNIFIDDIKQAITNDTILISVMLVNNETGAVLPVKEIRNAAIMRGASPIIHSDLVCAFGKLPININSLSIDMASISGHKVYALKGTGAIYIRKGVKIIPQILGGSQMNNIRSGTENTTGIISFGKAIEIKRQNIKEVNKRIEHLNFILKNELIKIPNIYINSPDDAICHILNFSVLGYKSEVMLHFLEQKGIYVSSGSACSSKKGASHVLLAQNKDKKIADSAIRISFGDYNTENDVFYLIEEIKNIIETIV